MDGVPLLMGGSAISRLRAVAAARPVNSDLWARQMWDEPELAYETIGRVAILTLDGPIAFNAGLLDLYFGVLPTGLVAGAIRRAADDPDVDALLVNSNCPGGTVAGQDDLERAMQYALQRIDVFAIAHEQMCSGAYRLLASADEIVTTETGEGGCIGSGIILTDYSEADAKAGVRVIPISDMPDKFAGAPGTKIDEETVEIFKAYVGPDSRRFQEHVAACRNMRVEDVAALRGNVLAGPEMVEAGLADRVVGFDEYVDELVARYEGAALKENGMSTTAQSKTGAKSSKPAQTSKKTNEKTGEKTGEEMTPEKLEETYPEVVEQIKKAAVEEMEKENESDEEEASNEEGEDEKENMEKDEKGNARATATNAATIAELDAAIPTSTPNREKVINDALRNRLTVTAAMRNALDVANKVAEKASRQAGINAEAASADPVNEGGGGSASGGAPASYEDAVKQTMAAENCSRPEAIGIVNKKHPELRMAYAGRAG